MTLQKSVWQSDKPRRESYFHDSPPTQCNLHTVLQHTVDHSLLWQVFTCIGVPPQIIRPFHDGVRACIRPHGGVCSDWFEAEQGLCQGYVLSPLLFNIFFAAVLTVVLQ